MVIPIIFFLLLATFLVYGNHHYKYLKAKSKRYDYTLSNIRKIFSDVKEVTFYGTYDSSAFYHLTKTGKNRNILRIQTLPKHGIIEFSYIDENQWYKNKNISRYDGDILFSIHIDALEFEDSFISKFFGFFLSDVNTMRNRIRNKKILFDEFYDGLMSMRHKNNGQSYTLDEYGDVKFIKNLFNERNS